MANTRLASDELDIADERPSVIQREERSRQPVRPDEQEMVDELPSIVQRDERSTPTPEANILSQESEEDMYIAKFIQGEEGNTPIPGATRFVQLLEDDMYTLSLYEQAKRNNIPSEDRIFRPQDIPDELPPSIRYALSLRETGSLEPDIPIEDLSIIKTDQLDGESQFHVFAIKYFELLESQGAMHFELRGSTRFPGFLNFPYRRSEKGEEYERIRFRPFAPKDKKDGECDADRFALLKPPYNKAVRVVNIIRKEISLVKKEHLELL
ncbi:predicted protein [Sclerotinia sclerotiorum 1980 UF-70]|uniref:Uncharacterized protein n=1 Tax=Sclerotinia sclerotiorum (strain ATCC 18683 / 1980 / Ss-1) TaxID=665079 RepID=A7E959_SCLS1|nr:predicted protein [Sclerotinia sclerotiorum 1980 UF-70]EDN96911.1 predicted protein [Sclerotinia sclerotiorum 1980 UF-70]